VPARAPTQAGGMNSKPLRLTTLLISTVLLLAALAAGAAVASAAPKAKKCPRGKTAWKVDGGPVCLASPVAGKKGSTGPAMAELWLRDASRSGPGGKLRLSPALRRALPRAGEVLARELGKVGRGAGASSASASNAARGPVVERYDGVIGREEAGNGVTVEGRVRARVYEDYSHEAEAEFEITDSKGNAILYTPDFRSLFAKDDQVGCPTAAGLVSTTIQGEIGGTVSQLKGKRVVASKTATQSWKIRGRGQVGTDARLHSVTADVSMTLKNFERGVQQETTVDTAATLDRQGTPKPSGTPRASVKVRAAGATRAEERAYEIESARQLAGSAEIAEALTGVAKHARNHLLEAEPTWYALPNECAQIAWDPGAGITVEPEETRSLTGAVIALRDGGRASGRIDVSAGDRGRLIPITPTFSAAAPASFIAAGGEPDAAGISVRASAIATSTAGRAQASWFARGTPVKVPERFVGTIASISSGEGWSRSFHGSASFTRTSLLRGPDGTVYAWYELTAANVEGAKEILGPPSGCRYEAKGGGGRLESGDLELRVLPSGEVIYALLYDLKIDSIFEPTDCPPPSGDPFDGEIVVFLNSRRPGPLESQLRPAGEGYWLTGNGVSDVTDWPDVDTTASWSLVPG
jgi:hypothetical protein